VPGHQEAHPTYAIILSMPTADSILAGSFALSGVALQQLISTVVSVANRRRDEDASRRTDHRSLYGRGVAQARRAQRALKDSLSNESAEVERRLHDELEKLAEINAEIRLVAPKSVVDAVLSFEDELRERAELQEKRNSGPLPLGPLVKILREDLEGI
jgi:hypothetical protein